MKNKYSEAIATIAKLSYDSPIAQRRGMTSMNAQISARILELVAGGMTGVDALKQVCGSEIVDAMLTDLYQALRAKGQARAAQALTP